MADTATAPEYDPNSREVLRAEAARRSYATTVRQIGRCAAKGCRVVLAADVPLQVRYQVVNGMGMVGYDLRRTAKLGAHPSLPCGHGSTRWASVQGRKTDTKCGPRCWNARLADCECECAGANHGQGHLAAAG